MIKKKDKILVCVNSSEHSKNALIFASEYAKEHNAALDALCVVEPVEQTDMMFSVSDFIMEENLDDAEKLCKEYAKEILIDIGVSVKPVIEQGNPVEKIVDVAETGNYDYIFLGIDRESNGGSILPELILALGNEIQCPITLVPEPVKED